MRPVILFVFRLAAIVTTITGLIGILDIRLSDIESFKSLPFVQYLLDRPVALVLLATGVILFLLTLLFRRRGLFIRESENILIFDADDDKKSRIKIAQLIQAYADNVSAMFTNFEVGDHGRVEKQGVRYSISSKDGKNGYQKQRLLFEGSPDKQWEIRHEFGEKLPFCFGLPIVGLTVRTGEINCEGCNKLESDFYEISTNRYQAGKLKLGIAIPSDIQKRLSSQNKKLSVKAERILYHAVEDIQVLCSENYSNLDKHAVYYIQCKTNHMPGAKYRITWKVVDA